MPRVRRGDVIYLVAGIELRLLLLNGAPPVGIRCLDKTRCTKRDIFPACVLAEASTTRVESETRVRNSR